MGAKVNAHFYLNALHYEYSMTNYEVTLFVLVLNLSFLLFSGRIQTSTIMVVVNPADAYGTLRERRMSMGELAHSACRVCMRT